MAIFHWAPPENVFHAKTKVAQNREKRPTVPLYYVYYLAVRAYLRSAFSNGLVRHHPRRPLRPVDPP